MTLHNSSRISSIDSLRFTAALLVCIAHSIERFHISTDFPVFILGKIGVVIFFCISGYLIPYSLKKESGGLKVFWNSRFFRLYPMYWVSIIFAVLCFDKYNAAQILANITMFQVFFKQSDLIGVYWTLVIEMFFYIACSIIFYFNRLNSSKWIFFSLISLSLLSCLFAYVRYTKGINLPIAVPLLLSIMFFGYMLKLKEKGIVTTKNLFISIAILMLSVLFSSYTGYTVKTHLTGESIHYVLSYSAGVLIFFLFYKLNIGGRLFSFLGEVSYSTYLIHPIVLFYIEKYVNVFPVWMLVVWFFAITYIASIVFFYLVEKPFIKVGKKVNMLYRTARV